MADEIVINASIKFTKSPISVLMNLVDGKFDLVGSARYVHGVALVDNAAPAAIPLGSLTKAGLAMIKNLDSTNFIRLYDSAGGTAFPKLKPGEPFVGRLEVAAPAWKADTAPCLVEYFIVED